MEIIIPKKNKIAVHPVAIFKQAWGLCRGNLGKLSAIYLIFNVPISIAFLMPMAGNLQGQSNSPGLLLFYILILIASIWSHIALLLAVKKAVNLEDYSVSQSINQVRVFFLKYLGTVLLSILIFLGIVISGGIIVTIILGVLSKVNKMLAVSIGLTITIAVCVSLIYFMLRWSLATAVCVLENVRPVAALKRSFSLITEYIHPVAGTYCLIMLIYIVCLLLFIVAGAFLNIGSDTEQANRISTIFSLLINIVLVPFWSAITVVLYKKLKEATEDYVHA
ncbi:MAG: hypothetical protein M0R17_10920 [Candidatus Omnitrophica bacterium]|jgi:hypothetical protein|nr:hypothetical protein [Candidatus Omnitrophota bacterium]MDD5253135.1 hypothetical protein [Candidatus Omnitrophota bacterium]